MLSFHCKRTSYLFFKRVVFYFNKFIFTILLVSCSTTSSKNCFKIFLNQLGNSVNSDNLEDSYISDPLVIPPNIDNVDWKLSIFPIINKVLSLECINKSSILFLSESKDITENKTKVNRVIEAIYQIMCENNEKFYAINLLQLTKAKKDLGLSIKDNLETKEKSLYLAHYLNADYLLYCIFYENKKDLEIEIQLISTRTREIISSIDRISLKEISLRKDFEFY